MRQNIRHMLAATACAATMLIAVPAATAAEPLNIDTPTASAQGWVGNTANPYGGQDYFVDADSGDDANPGTSQTQAWKSLNKVNLTTFAPGDRVLLKAGSVWDDQQLWPKGSGIDGKPITIAAYGEADAPRPYIATNGKVDIPFSEGIGTGKPLKDPDKVGTTGAVVLRNQHHWEISDLELSNDDDFAVDKTEKDGTVWDGISVSVNADLLERAGITDAVALCVAVCRYAV